MIDTTPAMEARPSRTAPPRVLLELRDAGVSYGSVRALQSATLRVHEGERIALLGLAFKANTDDRRDSPSLEIISRLVERGARVQAFDPTVTADATDGGMVVCADPYAACEGASVLAVLTEWDEFKWLDLDKVASLMATPRVVDARNLLDRSALLRRGFTYRAIGRS